MQTSSILFHAKKSQLAKVIADFTFRLSQASSFLKVSVRKKAGGGFEIERIFKFDFKMVHSSCINQCMKSW